MPKIEIAEQKFAYPFHGKQKEFVARVYASRSFESRDGSEVITGGEVGSKDYYREVPVKVEVKEHGRMLTICAFEGENALEATTYKTTLQDGVGCLVRLDVRYTLVLMGDGKPATVFHKNIVLPYLLDKMTWAMIDRFNDLI